MDLPTASTAFDGVLRTASNVVPLDRLATDIREKLAISKDALISSGRLLLQARQRVDAGEAGDLDFPAWVAANVQKGMREVNRLIRLVEAKSDEEALAAADRRREQKRDHERRKREAAKAAVVHGPPNPSPEVWAAQADKLTKGPLKPAPGADPLGWVIDAVKALPDELRAEFGRWFRQTYPDELAAAAEKVETTESDSTPAVPPPADPMPATAPVNLVQPPEPTIPLPEAPAKADAPTVTADDGGLIEVGTEARWDAGDWRLARAYLAGEASDFSLPAMPGRPPSARSRASPHAHRFRKRSVPSTLYWGQHDRDPGWVDIRGLLPAA